MPKEFEEKELPTRQAEYLSLLDRQRKFLREAGHLLYPADVEIYNHFVDTRENTAPAIIDRLENAPQPLNLDKEPVNWGKLGDPLEWLSRNIPELVPEDTTFTVAELSDFTANFYHTLCGAWKINSTTWKERIGGDNDYLFYWDYFGQHDIGTRDEIFEIPGRVFMSKGIQALVMGYEFMNEDETRRTIREAVIYSQIEKPDYEAFANSQALSRTITVSQAQTSLHFLHLARVAEISGNKARGAKWAKQFKDESVDESELEKWQGHIEQFLASNGRTTSDLWADTYAGRTGGMWLEIYGRDQKK